MTDEADDLKEAWKGTEHNAKRARLYARSVSGPRVGTLDMMTDNRRQHV
jgi:hypothetical protein